MGPAWGVTEVFRFCLGLSCASIAKTTDQGHQPPLFTDGLWAWKHARMDFVLIPGAGGEASYWHLVVPILEGAGHRAVAVDLPGEDPDKGLTDYVAVTVEAIGETDDVVLVAQSMGGFTAPMVCAALPDQVRQLVLVNAMIPLPGERPDEWWGNTGSADAREAAAVEGGYSTEFTVEEYFLHDVPQEVLETGLVRGRGEADIAFGQPCAISAWPDLLTRVVIGRDDRFFPADFQRRVARERLGADGVALPGGHLIALSQPTALAALLLEEGGSSVR